MEPNILLDPDATDEELREFGLQVCRAAQHFHGEFMSTLEELTDANDTIDELEDECGALDEKNQELQRNLDSANDTIDELEDHRGALDEKNKELQRKLDSANATINSYKSIAGTTEEASTDPVNKAIKDVIVAIDKLRTLQYTPGSECSYGMHAFLEGNSNVGHITDDCVFKSNFSVIRLTQIAQDIFPVLLEYQIHDKDFERAIADGNIDPQTVSQATLKHEHAQLVIVNNAEKKLLTEMKRSAWDDE